MAPLRTSDSTHPPPTVPRIDPSSRTSILAATTEGIEPRTFTMVASAAALPSRRSLTISSKMSICITSVNHSLCAQVDRSNQCIRRGCRPEHRIALTLASNRLGDQGNGLVDFFGGILFSQTKAQTGPRLLAVKPHGHEHAGWIGAAGGACGAARGGD